MLRLRAVVDASAKTESYSPTPGLSVYAAKLPPLTRPYPLLDLSMREDEDDARSKPALFLLLGLLNECLRNYTAEVRLILGEILRFLVLLEPFEEPALSHELLGPLKF